MPDDQLTQHKIRELEQQVTLLTKALNEARMKLGLTRIETLDHDLAIAKVGLIK